MSKKVYDLANELEMGAIDLVEKLKSMGMNVRNHMVTLSDDEVQEILSKLEAGNKKEAATKKSKKKVTKKKVAKKKVVKKTAAKTDDDGSEATNKKVTKKKTAKKKVVTVKKKEAAVDEPADLTEKEQPVVETQQPTPEDSSITAEEKKVEVATQAQRQEEEEKKSDKKRTVIRKKKEDLEKAASIQEKEDLYKEKLHSFTPIFVPEGEKQKTESKKATAGTEGPDDPSSVGVDDDKKDGKSKKKLGDLAAHISKKGAAVKAKDLNTMRADEELKFASGIVGKAIFTPAKKKKIYTGPTKDTLITEVKDSKRVLYVHDGATAEELAQKLSQRFEALANKALSLNLLVKKDDYLGLGLCGELAALYNYRVENRAFDEEKILQQSSEEQTVKKSKIPTRDPIITVMGHVDHGKTTLLDYIRSAKIASGEAGGITQHIGAYKVDVKGTGLTFLDTPGHAAFASMRQRGADVTDIVILVVAADDGVMPQTKESVRFCQEADKPLIVAVNKMDKEGVNPDRVKQELMEFGITPEEWGGDTQFVPISALKGDGIDNLLEAVQLQAEIMELKAPEKGTAEGVVIESKVEQGRGPVSTVLIQKGILSKGDALVVGETYGRARSLMDYSGKMLKQAGPSTPVQILGLNDAAGPGDVLNVVKNEREAKKIVDNRISERKALENTPEVAKASLEDFFADAATSGQEKKALKLIVRADVLGSYEAIKNSLESLGNKEVSVEVIGGGVGAITDNDVLMALSAGGYIIGFNMRPVTSARRLAEQKGVDIKNYSIIYNLINDITLALEGMLEPEYIEQYIGRAEVRDTFNIPNVGVIAGSAVIDGKIERGCKIRLLREGKIIHDGTLSSLKRFKDNVKEVKNGYECGISLDSFNDVKVSDIFEAYVMQEKKRKLESVDARTL